MYKQPDGQIDIFSILHPLEDMLDKSNRWFIRAQRIPWEELEKELTPVLYSSRGAPAKPLRIMLGSMLIGDQLGVSDAETVRQIQENPYLQYFIGLQEFQHDRVFAPLSLTLFRKRIAPQLSREVKKTIRDCMRVETED